VAGTGVIVSLMTHAAQVAAERGTRVSRLCEQALTDAGISVWREVIATAVRADGVLGHRHGEPIAVPADAVGWATGAAAPAWLAAGGLPVTPDGYLPVDAALRVVGTESLYAAGDVATLVEAPSTPKAGVYAVRMGPHLVESLRHALGQRTAAPVYRPQRRWLSLINVGDGTAIASWGPLALRARWAWQLKDRIDRRFVARFRAERSADQTQLPDALV
jgi:NADH dehydrogenase FAD-containing subunit